ncbi:MAG: hypothetical protein AAFO63_04900 [Pseudomonadota bacterium]
MKQLMLGAAAIAMVSACNAEDTSTTTPVVQELGEIVVRTGNPALAPDALAAMSLAESGSGILTFADSSVEGANATFSDVTVAGEEALKAESLVFEGLDMTDGNANFARMVFNNVVLSDPEGEEDGEVRIATLELVNPSPELAAWMAGALQTGAPTEFPEAEKISFDSWAISGLTGSFDDTEASGTFGLDSIEIRGVSDLKAAQMKMSDLSFNVLDTSDDMNADISLGDLTLSNVDAKVLSAIQDNIGDEEALMAAVMDVAYENPMDPGYDAISMSDFNVAVAGADFSMPSMTTFVERNQAGQPVKFVTEEFTMNLKADPEGGEAGSELAQGLSMIGYEEVTINGAGVSEYDPDLDIISFDADSNYFELVDGAKFSFGGKVEGYSQYASDIGTAFDFEALAAGGEPDPNAMTDALGAISIHNFELQIADDSLVNRVFNLAATQMGQDPAELKTQAGAMLSMAPMMIQGSGVDVALVTEATTAVASFLNEPGTLTLKLSPDAPLSIAAMMENPDPAGFTKDALGFSASNN